MEVKLPMYRDNFNYAYNTYIRDGYNDCKRDMLQFFIEFLDEHIELHKEKMWDATLIQALKINFKSRFMENK